MITPNKLREAAKNQDTQQMTQSLIEAANVLALALATIDQAKQSIRAWHDMRVPDESPSRKKGDKEAKKQAEQIMWDLYQESPEMRMINAFLRYRDPVLPEDAAFAASILRDLEPFSFRASILAISGDNKDRSILGSVAQLRSLAETVAIGAK